MLNNFIFSLPFSWQHHKIFCRLLITTWFSAYISLWPLLANSHLEFRRIFTVMSSVSWTNLFFHRQFPTCLSLTFSVVNIFLKEGSWEKLLLIPHHCKCRDRVQVLDCYCVIVLQLWNSLSTSENSLTSVELLEKNKMKPFRGLY